MSERLLRLLRTVVVAALAGLTLVACTAAGGDEASTLPAAFDQGVPAPSGRIVLTVTSDAGSVDWDIETLALLDQQTLTIEEPFLKQEHTYTGPLWRDVLRASGVDVDAGELVELVALDDYAAEIPTDADTLDGVVLAHLDDGAPIEIADGGPIRLIWPDDNDGRENANNWIWSIRTARTL